MPNYGEFAMNLVLGIRTEAGSEAKVAKQFAGFKEIESLFGSASRKGLVSMTRTYANYMKSMTSAEKGTAALRSKIASITMPSQASARSITNLAAKTDELAAQATGPLKDSLQSTSDTLHSLSRDMDTHVRRSTEDVITALSNLSTEFHSIRQSAGGSTPTVTNLSRQLANLIGNLETIEEGVPVRGRGILGRLVEGSDITAKEIYKIDKLVLRLSEHISEMKFGWKPEPSIPIKPEEPTGDRRTRVYKEAKAQFDQEMADYEEQIKIRDNIIENNKKIEAGGTELSSTFDKLSSRVKIMRESMLSANAEAGEMALKQLPSIKAELEKVIPSAANLPPVFDALTKSIEGGKKITWVTMQGYIALAEQLRGDLTGATVKQRHATDKFIKKLKELNSQLVQADSIQRHRERGAKGIFPQTEETMALLDVAGAAAHGMMLATAALKGNVTQLAFSVIFLKFNMVDLTLKFAKLFAMMIVFMKIGKLVFWSMKEGAEYVGVFQSSLARLGATADREGSKISKAFFEPFLKLSVAPAFNVLTDGIKSMSKDFQWLMKTVKSVDDFFAKELGETFKALARIISDVASMMVIQLGGALKIIGWVFGLIGLVFSPIFRAFNWLLEKVPALTYLMKGLAFIVGLLLWKALFRLSVAAFRAGIEILGVIWKMILLNETTGAVARSTWTAIKALIAMNKTVRILTLSMWGFIRASLVLIPIWLAYEGMSKELETRQSKLVKVFGVLKWILVGLAAALSVLVLIFGGWIPAAIVGFLVLAAKIAAAIGGLVLLFQVLAHWMGWSPGVGAVTTKLIKVWKTSFIPTLKNLWKLVKDAAYAIRIFLLPQLEKLGKTKIGVGGEVDWSSTMKAWELGFADFENQIIAGWTGFKKWFADQRGSGGILEWTTGKWWTDNVWSKLGLTAEIPLSEAAVFAMVALPNLPVPEFPTPVFPEITIPDYLSLDWWSNLISPIPTWWNAQTQPGGVFEWATNDWWTIHIFDPLKTSFDNWKPDWLTGEWWSNRFAPVLETLRNIALSVISFIAIITQPVHIPIPTVTNTPMSMTGQIGQVPPLPGGLAGVTTGIAAAIDNILSSIPGEAEGGVVRRPTLAFVGEAGPEAIIPLNRGSGVGGITINVYISGNNVVGEGAADELGNIVSDRILRRIKAIAPYSVR